MTSQPKVAYGGDKKGVIAKLFVRNEDGLVFVVTFLHPYGELKAQVTDYLATVKP